VGGEKSRIYIFYLFPLLLVAGVFWLVTRFYIAQRGF
jgi:hypothetical protein